MKILVVTKYRWRTRNKKHETICALLKTGGIQATVKTIHLNVGKPEIKGGRIDPSWYETNITSRAQDYDHVIFQFSEADGERWGLESGIRGHNIKDTDRIGESWVCCDENDIVTFRDGSSRNKYEKTVPHEIAHELKNKKLTTLDIHDFDYKNEINNIEGFYKALNKPMYIRPFKEWVNVTQKYGNPDPKLYPRSGHHIGTDFATPLGTKILAPKECEVTNNGMSPALGNWCEVKIDDWYMVCLHLEYIPHKGMYGQGEEIGRIGATGMIQGVHAHIEAWFDPMDRTKLTKDNWNKLTFDVTTEIK